MKPRADLVPIEESHIQRYVSLSGDPELVETMGWRPFTETETKRFLRAVEKRTIPRSGDEPPAVFSIVEAEQAHPIGYVVLKGIDSKQGSAELGIAIMDRRYRSSGYGAQALRAAARYAFDQLELCRIDLTVFPSNHRAIGAYEKAGFDKIGILENAWTMPGGRKRDMLHMALGKARWRHREAKKANRRTRSCHNPD